jgi:integrase
MHEIENPAAAPNRVPWNKGKLIGPRPPLRQKHVWAIRTRLQMGRQVRDLALFNLAVDSKLRGCDVVAVRVDDVAPNGHAIERATVRQRKTARPVRFELTEQTRQAINDYLAATGKRPRDYLFSGRRFGQNMSTRQYARLVGLADRNRTGPTRIRNPFAAPYQGNADLSTHRKPESRSAPPGPHED